MRRPIESTDMKSPRLEDLSMSEGQFSAPQVSTSDVLVIFGATGDLAMRMLLPSLYFLDSEGWLPDRFRIIGIARRATSRSMFVDLAREAALTRLEGHSLDAIAWARFAARLDCLPLDATSVEEMMDLYRRLEMEDGSVPIFYLSTSPSLFGPICGALKSAGLTRNGARVVLEKPVGRSLTTSRIINEAVTAAFSEDQIFRIDHYLGKETVQNLLALRFANRLFEPLWNNLAIDHVQITVSETEGVGERWRYYDEYGAIRDMLQNHILQLLCLVAMEPPSELTPDAVRDEKIKVLRALRPIRGRDVKGCTVRGQYAAGLFNGTQCASYAEEKGGPSDTETFAALRVDIDNWRWAGVPFFLRTGKRLPVRRTQIVVQFKPVSHSIFPGFQQQELTANRLVIDLQPEEDIRLMLMNKMPGLDRDGMQLQTLPLSLNLPEAVGHLPRRRIAYERLLLDVIHGNSTLFVRRDEVERAWQWIDAIVHGWNDFDRQPISYTAGTWGPSSADQLIEQSNRSWHA
jgi:glucose-6-phosphate 1-dehydrogenase